MLEKNLGQRMLVVVGVLAVGLLILVDWSSVWRGDTELNLRPGLDIAGGVSMIFEINDEGMENYRGNLAEDMKELLQERVDPKGVYDLTWRVHGTKRIEIQMPLPPAGLETVREEYLSAWEALQDTNITRGELELILATAPERRGEAIAEAAAGSEERAARLHTAAEAYDKWQALLTAEDTGATTATADGEATTQPTTQPTATAIRDAEEEYADAVERVLDTNFPLQRLEDVMALEQGSDVRKTALSDWEDSYGYIWPLISKVVDAHEEWKQRKGYLDGPADLRRLLRGAGVLTFRIMVEPDPENPAEYEAARLELQERGPAASRGDINKWFKIEDPVNFFNLKSPKQLEEMEPRDFIRPQYGYVVGQYQGEWYVLAKTGSPDVELRGDSKRRWQLRSAWQDQDEFGRPSVRFAMDPVGGAMFGELTGANIGQKMGIFLDDECYSAATIQSRITSSGTITGNFGQAKVQYLIRTMQAGALPARLKDTPISERVLGSSLGAANLHKAFRAGVIGVVTVMVFMAIYYMWAGMIVNFALVMNIILVLSAMAMLNARISLAGIAGIILTVGMSVDANVLIFERMREEKERGSTLRMIIKNGYDKAFSTIIDANITTLLTCIILGYVGSEEVKGFGLTLGWGIAISLFTALFVTRVFFGLLLKYHLIKDVKMLKFIGVPKIDWYAKRKFFLPLSLIIMGIGMSYLISRGADALDVEFRGGVSAEFALHEPTLMTENEGEVQADDIHLKQAIDGVVDGLRADGAQLANAKIVPTANDPQRYVIEVPGVPAARLAAMLAEPLEDDNIIVRAGIDTALGEGQLAVRVNADISEEKLRDYVHAQARAIATSADQFENLTISEVLETGATDERGTVWSVTTTVTNKRLIEHVMEEAFGDNLDRQAAINYTFRGSEDNLPVPVLPMGDEQRVRLGDLAPFADAPAAAQAIDVTAYKDGAAMYFKDLDPPVTLGELKTRLRNMRLQPDYADLPWREFDVIGIEPTGEEYQGAPEYRSVAIVVVDPQLPASGDLQAWASELATRELRVAEDTLSTEQSLRKVAQFKPEIAAQAQTRAMLALLLSWAMIIGYMWLRFGKATYGVAGVAALVHDVLIALSFVGISHLIGGSKHWGGFLLIEDFHINMTVIAAMLTIIGYSINDTIVVFDRIRETRGRLGIVTPQIVNDSINQTLARTVITSGTTILVLLSMYIWGGSTIRPFNYCMIVGILTGTYSSIAVASPLLILGMRREAKRAGLAAPARAK